MLQYRSVKQRKRKRPQNEIQSFPQSILLSQTLSWYSFTNFRFRIVFLFNTNAQTGEVAMISGSNGMQISVVHADGPLMTLFSD